MISQKNIHIESFLDYYCELDEAPEYGVMIDGEWGSGKTWFVKKYQEKIENDNRKVIYVSLYGLSKVKEINEAIFQALHPVLAHKSTKLAGKILKGAIKATIKIDIDADKKDDVSISTGIPDVNLPDYLSNADKHILIFDDLERCEIPTGQLLGYINHFIEHEKMKCILVSNEFEMEEKNKNSSNKSYIKIRDKIIGKRFGFTSDFDSAISDFLASQSCKNSSSLLIKHIEIIKSIYLKAGYNNFRHLKHALWDFERIFLVVIKDSNLEEEIQEHILQSHFLLSFELKSGGLLNKDIIEINKRRMKNFFVKYNDVDKRSCNEKNIDEIISKYIGICSTEIFPSVDFWEVFFEKGIVDDSIAKNSIDNSIYRYYSNMPSWKRLLQCMNLNDNEFINVLSDVQKEYIDRKYKDVGIVLHILGVKLWLIDIGILTETKDVVIKEAKDYIDSMEKDKTLPEENFLDSDINNTSYDNSAYFSRETVEFEEVFTYLTEAKNRQYINSLNEKAEELMKEMQKDFSLFTRRLILNNSVDNTYYKIPILSKIDPGIFLAELEKLNNEKKREFGFLLTSRYQFPNYLAHIREEIPWLKSMVSLLKNEANIKKGKMSGHIYTILVKKFEESIQRFSS
ncbi:KAP family NTPase [Leeia sp. TBRC 13508]|uniref:KAP family NTPase n=1 Tax=Leeia speluncae TaxID=2884804 RepID=A0ABS8DA16_9NEIS|nr:P-loop NTPase fold protein [Leeia speluncae]MCB6185048.1 KAP family NTPase [Leeia speluncae]